VRVVSSIRTHIRTAGGSLLLLPHVRRHDRDHATSPATARTSPSHPVCVSMSAMPHRVIYGCVGSWSSWRSPEI
jgi:hypothetical protein